jgi:ubiquinone/menaquinone biosynthesis C-methylase UbiE
MFSRSLKARKIAALLNIDRRCSHGDALLEIGTGTGGIAHYFAHCEAPHLKVSAVDVVDNRHLSEGYEFRLVDGCELPFADASFDVLISNHVIEHVGGEIEQRKHLSELHRLLKPGGIGYLAVPNRWMLVEPHYKLAFLSWLPVPLRNRYLRLAGKGRVYDCEPLTLRALEQMLIEADLQFENVCLAAIRELHTLEPKISPLVTLLAALPPALIKPLLPLFPTLCYVICKRADH